jgi:hypothetical protein
VNGKAPGNAPLLNDQQRQALHRMVESGPSCLVPGFDGALFSPAWRDALWAKFFMAAPLRQRQSVERYSVVKRA